MDPQDLLRISKPSRYLGGEIHSLVKDLSQVRLKFALAFPDVYEVGMSHLGFQILYHILNQKPQIACGRVFAPWPDMEDLLRGKNLPLTSLEYSLPLAEYDVIGFSLQYELNYTGILHILDLGRIPLRAADRGEKDPLVIGGGPCALNPEPVADFFDLLVLGDAEEAILDICQEVLKAREGREPKEKLLERLSRLEGIYVPSLFHPEYGEDGKIKKILPHRPDYSSVLRRVLPDLNLGEFPSRPILPFMEIIHDRLNIEIARGCTRGCRFCQAGMIYRPLRERSPQKILRLVEEGLKSTGYDEVSLLSLSSGDYSCIEPLLSEIIQRCRPERTAVSLPSLRVETLTPSLIRQIQEVRKTGFTLAPEAGTERLRRVINKGNTEEDLLSTIRSVFSANWQLVKLYFMIGLPTEAEGDLEGMVSLCRRALKEARRVKSSAQINVSVSTFIPKPNTPFQWEPQDLWAEVRRKQNFLRKSLDRQGLRLKWSDPRVSLIEGVFARGDRRLSQVAETAYKLGSRLDGWGDHFRYELWEEAFSRTGLDPSFYTRRREPDEVFPWAHLDSRVDPKFLQEERQRSLQGVPTPDCRRDACTGCGVCYGAEPLANLTAGAGGALQQGSGGDLKPRAGTFPVRRFRARFTKVGPAKFLGHLELSQSMIRAFRRASIPLVYSQGYHPLPRISFGPPIPVGYESLAEYLDYQIQGTFHPQEALSRLNQTLPEGIRILENGEIPLKSRSIFDSISLVLYLILFSSEPPPEWGDRFNREDKIPVFWARKGKTIDLKAAVESFSFADERAAKMVIRPGKEGTLKPEEVLGFLSGLAEENLPSFSIQKLQVQFEESTYVQRNINQRQFGGNPGSSVGEWNTG